MSLAEERQSRQSARNGWLLSTPALVILAIAAIGPLVIVLVYSFLTPGDYGNVVWEFSWNGWKSVFVEEDIFEGTLTLADAHLAIFWRSRCRTPLKLSQGWCNSTSWVTIQPFPCGSAP